MSSFLEQFPRWGPWSSGTEVGVCTPLYWSLVTWCLLSPATPWKIETIVSQGNRVDTRLMEPVELVSMSASNWPEDHGQAGVQAQLCCKMSFMCTQVVQITVTVYLGVQGCGSQPPLRLLSFLQGFNRTGENSRSRYSKKVTKDGEEQSLAGSQS